MNKMSLTGEEVDDSDFLEVSETNFQRVYNSVAKVGYADGANDGRESVFQEGFDYGYADGLRTGFETAKYKFFYNTMRAAESNQNDKLLKEMKALENLRLTEENSQDHYQLLKNRDLPLKDISQCQNDYVEKYLEDMSQQFPHTTNLLTKI